MTEPTLDAQVLEDLYDALAQALDAVGRERETLFLAKLALTLGACIADPQRIDAAIAIARAEIESAPPR